MAGGPIHYAETQDITPYLPTVDGSTAGPIWSTLLDVVSRAVDLVTDRYFWNEGPSTRYFDSRGGRWLDVRKHDFYAVTAVKVALFENADPAGGSWITLIGDGVTPPSNFFLEPSNPDYVAGSTNQRWPYRAIVLPELPIQANFNGILIFTPGRRTVSITATWGWPVVPSDIKDLVVKVLVKMWKSRELLWNFSSGASSSQLGITPGVVADRFFDVHDLGLLNSYRRPAL